jgi:hypothetical protein
VSAVRSLVDGVSFVSRRPPKYHAQPTMVDGIRFASKKEARRYGELKLLEKAGEIHSLRVQPSFDLDVIGGFVNRVNIGVYRADFDYFDRRKDTRVVEDVKGFKTPLYRWKKKHVEAQYGISITEI